MKKIIYLLMFIFPALGLGQGVAINNDNSHPNDNAILDVKSESKGVLLPRLTTAQRTGIVSAVPGLTVFDSETFSYWVYLGDLNGGWTELLSSLDKHWDRTGNNVFNNNLGNVGIGTSNPSQKLSINATDPSIDFMNAGTSKGFLQANGNNMKLGTYFNNTNGKIVFNTKAVDRMWIDETGFVGIGTSEPTSVLTVNGTNPWIEMQHGGVDKGYLWASGNDLKVGTNAGNTSGNLVFQTKVQSRMVIDPIGRVAIGTTTPANSSILTINDSEPLIQIQSNGVGKGFIQVVGDDVKIGTNTSNDDGDFIIRTNGSDRLTINEEGDMFLNSPSPILVFEKNGLSSGYLNVSGNDMTLLRSLTGGGGKLQLKNGVSGIFLSEDGHANIGTGAKPVGYKLSIEGNAIATEFTALAIQNWPDYVFADDYQLKSIDEVEQFISENNHLPNIPSAKEIEEEGVHLGDMSKRIIEKVEELTLYVIQLNEQNKLLQEQINVLKYTNKTNQISK